jgi:hypothetical protein
MAIDSLENANITVLSESSRSIGSLNVPANVSRRSAPPELIAATEDSRISSHFLVRSVLLVTKCGMRQ